VDSAGSAIFSFMGSIATISVIRFAFSSDL
jgi:hypothetical protein